MEKWLNDILGYHQNHGAKRPPLLALANLGKATQIEMILFVAHHRRCQWQERWSFSWCVIANGFANKLCQWKTWLKISVPSLGFFHEHLSNIDCLSFVMCPLLVLVFQGLFSLLQPLTVLIKQTRQSVRAIKQSILLRCQWFFHRMGNHRTQW